MATGNASRKAAADPAKGAPNSKPVRLPVKEFRRLDGNAPACGVSIERLMANAGNALAAAIQEAAPAGPVWLLCGKGNNGGDGFAAARILHDAGRDVRVWLAEPAKRIRSAEARQHFDALPSDIMRAWRKQTPPPAGALVDCLLGSGLHGPPRAPYSAIIQWINDAKRDTKCRVIACDVPSGLATPLAVQPHQTVTFHAQKEGMSKATCGDIHTVDIGIPKQAATRIGPGDLDVGYPRQQQDGHKGSHGRVLVIGGGPYTGAPHYAGMAAMRTGADLVTVATAAEAAATIAAWGPTLIVRATEPGNKLTPKSQHALGPLLAQSHAVVLGPGMGTDIESMALAIWVLDATAERDTPVVVDADALQIIDAETARRHGHRLVLTPHKGECERMLGRSDDKFVQKWAHDHGVTIVRKGAVDLVAGTAPRTCHRGNPAMTVGGTGDVLAGTIGALLARGATPYDAACAGIYLVNVAGERAATSWGPGLSATELHEAIPAILVELN